ncbi:MAG: hypothetical protein ACLGPL_05905, partial [Acidobacteriota bacterium]
MVAGKKKRALAVLLSVGLALLVLVAIALEGPTRVEVERLSLDPCRIFYDRNGRLLRFEPDGEYRRHVGLAPDSIP